MTTVIMIMNSIHSSMIITMRLPPCILVIFAVAFFDAPVAGAALAAVGDITVDIDEGAVARGDSARAVIAGTTAVGHGAEVTLVHHGVAVVVLVIALLLAVMARHAFTGTVVEGKAFVTGPTAVLSMGFALNTTISLAMLTGTFIFRAADAIEMVSDIAFCASRLVMLGTIGASSTAALVA